MNNGGTMTGYTEEQVEEKVREVVEKTERSFGGTFKRLKSENEEIRAEYENAVADHETARSAMEKRIAELEAVVSESKKHISELAIQGELQRQLREKGPLPERFVHMESIEYADDIETLSANVAEAIEKGRGEFEQVMSELGIAIPHNTYKAGNPTNPPNRDTTTAQNMKGAEAREALHDMVRRGLIK